jgi:hypothetical protein
VRNSLAIGGPRFGSERPSPRKPRHFPKNLTSARQLVRQDDGGQRYLDIPSYLNIAQTRASTGGRSEAIAIPKWPSTHR